MNSDIPKKKRRVESVKQTDNISPQDTSENAKEMNVDELLALGEAHVGDDKCDIDDDWEEVEELEHKPESLSITVQIEGTKHKKAPDPLRKEMIRIKKELQILMHKTHLLCWIAHIKFVNNVLNSSDLMAAALSLITSKNVYPPKHADLKYLEFIVHWFTKKIILHEKKLDESKSIYDLLCEQFETKSAGSKRLFNFMFVIILRTLGLQTRVAYCLRVVPLKPENERKNDTNIFPESIKDIKKFTANKRERIHLDMVKKKLVKNAKEKLNNKLKNREEESPYFRKPNSQEEESQYFRKPNIQEEESPYFKNKHLASVTNKPNKQYTSLANKSSKSNTRLTYKTSDANTRLASATNEPSSSSSSSSNQPSTSLTYKSNQPSTSLTYKRSKPSTSRAIATNEPSSSNQPSTSLTYKRSKPSTSRAIATNEPISSSNQPSTSLTYKSNQPSTNLTYKTSKPSTSRAIATNEPSSSKGNQLSTSLDNKSSLGNKAQIKTESILGSKIEVEKRLTLNCEKSSKSCDTWAEVFLEAEEKWISVDVIKGKIHCVRELYAQAAHPVSYILGCNNDSSIKDITRRYVPNWFSTAMKQRVDTEWWKSTLQEYLPKPSAREIEEDDDLNRHLIDNPIPNTIKELKGHPLYVLKTHLNKFEAIFPPNTPPLGFVNDKPVYARDCVHKLRSRGNWHKEAREVKPKEEPYKTVLSRPKIDKMTGQRKVDQSLELFGIWQTRVYTPPVAVDGKVPRNQYGNVELFKPCMLPKGTVHLKDAGLGRVAKILDIDYANAVTGFDFHAGGCHAVYEGIVVCEEYKDLLLDAWKQEQVKSLKRKTEKQQKRIWGNWRRLIRGLIIRENLKLKYNFHCDEH